MHAGWKMRTLVSTIVAAAVAGATVAMLAQRVSQTSVPVCIKSNGQIRVLVSAGGTCDASEQRADWVVGGEVMDIAIGQGLIGSRDGGTFQLAVDPSLMQACTTGCQDRRIFAGFNDGPAVFNDDLTTIARLDVPPGDYAIFAKLMLENSVGTDRVDCRLSAEADFDAGAAVVEDDLLPFIGYTDTLNLNVVHHFDDPGVVALACQAFDPDFSTRYRNLKIIAVQASGISNVFLPAP